MRHLIISAAAVSSLALGGCSTDPYLNHQASSTAAGAVVGAGAGAVAGSVLPGIGTAAGAAVGAILGGAAGAVIGGKQYYRDTRGYCYYVDSAGQPHYAYNVKC